MPTLLFTAIVCSRVEPGIAPGREEGEGERREMEERKEENEVEGRKGREKMRKKEGYIGGRREGDWRGE